MWVFNYKFDDNSFFLKHKFRIVTHSDLQSSFFRKTYTNTLTMQVFHALAAIIYSFNIESLIYLMNVLFINIVHSTSLLVQFMQNSSLIHTTEADHLIIYLHDRKWLSLVMNGNTDLSSRSIKIFEDSSDASYSDNMTTRRSFKEYIFWLFDHSIDWQAIQQNMITISKIEAKLLTLTHVSISKLYGGNDSLNR